MAPTIKMPVDTGSTHIVLSPGIIKEPGLHETPYSVEPTLADKRRTKARLYLAEVEARDRKDPGTRSGLGDIDTTTWESTRSKP